MNDLNTTNTDQVEDDGEDEQTLVPLGQVLKEHEDERIKRACRAAVEASSIILRQSLAAAGAELRVCRKCGADIATFSGFSSKRRIVSVATGGDHVELCSGIDDDTRARLLASAA